ncbi:hypothetical protein [Fischerella sp. PCC 9605]|nr:hypothetical protein [Fischerella sp. PCC 9605]
MKDEARRNYLWTEYNKICPIESTLRSHARKAQKLCQTLIQSGIRVHFII